MAPALTILTDPIPVGWLRLPETFRRLGRQVRSCIKPRPAFMRGLPYRGHFGVTRSLVEGLRKINVRANYNPQRLADVGSTVVVLAGLRTLQQALVLKRRGYTIRLLAGPNILVLPSDHPDVIAAPEVDVCITPSDWVCRLYERECAALQGRCASWPAGVDTEYWQPDSSSRDPKKILVFSKNGLPAATACVQLLEKRHYDVQLITYGSYKQDDYREALRRSSLMVGFSTSESQGLAWTEAWSVDVPTLLWFQDHLVWRDRTISGSTTAPYLTANTGRFFSSPAEFEAALSAWEASKEAYAPRRWVLENMSDELCARHLCKVAGVEIP